jgi:hypothetical protein
MRGWHGPNPDRLAGDAADTDDGWQQRYGAAARIARRELLPADGQELLGAVFDEPTRPEPSRAAERDALRTLFRTLGAGGEVAPKELLDAMATAGFVSTADLPHALADHYAAQVAGTDTCGDVIAALSLARFRAVAWTASLAELQHPVAAVWMAWTHQGLVLLIGMARRAGVDETHMSAWPQITADTLCKLRDDPGVAGMGSTPKPVPVPRGGSPTTLVVAGLGLLVVPGHAGHRRRLPRPAGAAHAPGRPQRRPGAG